jgi:hypothetical protein
MIDFNKNPPAIGSKWQTNVEGIVLKYAGITAEYEGWREYEFILVEQPSNDNRLWFDVEGYCDTLTNYFDLKITGPYIQKSCLNCKRYRKEYCDLLGTYVDSKMEYTDIENFYCNKHEVRNDN